MNFCVELALGWGVRNIYFLESHRRKSPYVRGKNSLSFSSVNESIHSSPVDE